MTYYLAVDIGASSGRHMLGHLKDGKLKLEEVYRFSNGMVKKNGHLCWDIEQLFQEILNGLKACATLGKAPSYMGIDTWAVDFVLLDENDQMLGDAVGYRDARTDGMDVRVEKQIPLPDLYERTGIQKLPFNTIYQLMAVKTKTPHLLAQAQSFLMIPDYFNFRLTGVKKTEYTNATSTQLVNIHKQTWDDALIETLEYPSAMFQEIAKPGATVGKFTAQIAQEVGFDCDVLLPATHDTASAVVAVPSVDEDTLYLSSGTWSLMGVERMEPDTSEASRAYNFSHEGGYDDRYRYLKNIMGLWMIQELKRELNDAYSFEALCDLAAQSNISSIVDCQDQRFLAPKSMMAAITGYCTENEMPVPTHPGEFAAVIYNSLAECYRATVTEIETMTKKTYDKIHVIGGGANAAYLNKITAVKCGKDVLAGPVEATAIGNVAVQMLATGAFTDLREAREVIYESFEMRRYEQGAN